MDQAASLVAGPRTADGSPGRTLALLLLTAVGTVNIVGLGCVPLAIGMLSGPLSAAGEAAPLRNALLWAAPVSVLAALAYFALSRVVERDAANVLKEATA